MSIDTTNNIPSNGSDNSWLLAIVNCLLPGDAQHWPSAASLGLNERVAAFIRQSENGEQILTRLFDLSQPAFANFDHAQQVDFLQTLEATESVLFERLLTAAYNMYYTDAEVRQVIERVTGYEARPPQPEGYVLEPFDETLLNKVRHRDPFWR